MEPKKVSKKLLMRLPAYLRYLKLLPEDVENISATQLANALGLGEVLVRKDLAKVSSGGRRKLGYVRENLIRDMEDFFRANSSLNAVIVGTGKLGQAFLDYGGFEESGMEVLAGFDINPPKKRSAAGKPIYPMERLSEFCRNNGVSVGIIMVPDDQAQIVCDELIACGIRAVWNFAPVVLDVPEEVVVQSDNLRMSLASLYGQLKERNNFDKLA